jgi:cell division septation protein DedD
LRRRRRVLTASSIGAVTLTLTVVIASVAGAGTHRSNVSVSNPPGVEAPETSTTVAPLVTTTVTLPPPPPVSKTTIPRPPNSTSTSVPGISFIPAACRTGDHGVQPATEEFILLADGSVRVHLAWATNTLGAAEIAYRFDNGTTGTTDYAETYTSDTFGVHWYDEWPASATGAVGCSARHTFDVDPATATPDTIPETTTVPTGDTTTTSVPTNDSTPTTSAP